MIDIDKLKYDFTHAPYLIRVQIAMKLGITDPEDQMYDTATVARLHLLRAKDRNLLPAMREELDSL